jgi:hypothetical protein
MVIHNLDRKVIDDTLKRFIEVTAQGQLPVAAVLIAAAEFIGRAIVEVGDTPVQGVQLAQAIEDHIKRTLKAGYTAKGYDMGRE